MKILGIDYGRKKIGVAVGDLDTKMAEPLMTINNSQFSICNLQTIINDQKIQKIIIGTPGGEIEAEIQKFGQEIEKQTGAEIEYFDETLSTQDAQKLMIESGKRRKSRKEKEDAIAAAVMLQLFIESHPS